MDLQAADAVGRGVCAGMPLPSNASSATRPASSAAEGFGRAGAFDYTGGEVDAVAGADDGQAARSRPGAPSSGRSPSVATSSPSRGPSGASLGPTTHADRPSNWSSMKDASTVIARIASTTGPLLQQQEVHLPHTSPRCPRCEKKHAR